MMIASTTAAARSPDEQQRLHEALRDVFEERISFNKLLGIRVESFDAEQPRISFEMRPQLVGQYIYGRLHGGVISAVLDAAGGFALVCALTKKHKGENAEQIMHRFARIGTIDLRIDFCVRGSASVLKPPRESPGWAVASDRPSRRCRTRLAC